MRQSVIQTTRVGPDFLRIWFSGGEHIPADDRNFILDLDDGAEMLQHVTRAVKRGKKSN
jgi:hypothetical protein